MQSRAVTGVCETGAAEPLRPLFLVVEDDSDDFLLLERALKIVDPETPIVWAHDGAEAMTMASQLAPKFPLTCLVVDVQLPCIDGFELVEQIRANGWSEDLRIVFLTGNSNPVLRSRAFASGAQAVLLKPSRHSSFLEIAQELNRLGRHGPVNHGCRKPPD